jgi:hypothetical protein
MKANAVSLLALLAFVDTSGCGGEGGQPVTLEEATQIVVAQLVDPAVPVVVFAHPDAVTPGQDLRPYALRDEDFDGPLDAIPIEASSWLLWIDDRPGAEFVHPNRVALVDRATGALSVHDQVTWPVLDGQGLWVADGQRTDPTQFAYPESGDAPRAGVLTAAPRPAAVTCDGMPGQAVVINGWSDGESGHDNFANGAQDMADLLDAAGFDTTRVGPEAGTPCHSTTGLSRSGSPRPRCSSGPGTHSSSC